jgi:hypothetical protein
MANGGRSMIISFLAFEPYAYPVYQYFPAASNHQSAISDKNLALPAYSAIITAFDDLIEI